MIKMLRPFVGMALVAVAWGAGCAYSTQPAAALQLSGHEPRLFWSNALVRQGNLISSAKLDGSDFRRVAIRLPRGRHAVRLAVANGRIYWAGYSYSASDTWIGSARLDGSDVRQHQLIVEDSLNALVVEGPFMFIATPDRVERVRLGGKRVPRLLAKGININSLAVGGNYVYWGDDGPVIRNQPWHGTIHRADLDGSHSVKFRIAGLDQPACLVLAGPYLFWGDYEANRIGRVRLDGSEAATLLETAGSPIGLAFHAGTLYWAAVAEGETAELDAIGSAALDPSFAPQDVNQSLLPLESLGEPPYSLALG